MIPQPAEDRPDLRALLRDASVEMSTRPRPGQILVGVDGSGSSIRAVEWAVVRASAVRTSLRLVHAFKWPVWNDPYGLTLWWQTNPARFAQQLLDDAATHARGLVPTLDITTVVRVMGPAAAILAEGLLAEVIVLGESRQQHRSWWRRAPVATQVARRARGRVVVVGHDNEVLT